MRTLAPGSSAKVRSPATSANLGPGFDCLGLALDLWDDYAAQTEAQPGVRVVSTGQGAADLPTDASHLVARSLLAGLSDMGVQAAGIRLSCRNNIPHGRGLGSSSAAIVGGLALARELVAGQATMSQARMVALASEIEGHPDNVAAAVLGGATIAWVADSGEGCATRAAVREGLRVTVLVPESRADTEAARGLLPDSVPYRDAVFNIGRAALLVHALSADPALLFTATGDRIHQEYRSGAYAASLSAVHDLRRAGFAAAISGAGPTVLVFGPLPFEAAPTGFAVHDLRVSEAGVTAVG